MTKDKASQTEMKSQINLSARIKPKKVTQGRKKIKIEKIPNVSNRQVTFSKRRMGLFKKAAEISILTGARVALIVESSGKRVHTFGYPDIDSVLAGYQNGYQIPDQPLSQADLVQQKLHNDDYKKLCLELEAEKKKLAELENAGNGSGLDSDILWFEKPLDGMSLEELSDMRFQLEELQKNVGNSLNDFHTCQPLALTNNNRIDHHDFGQRLEISNNGNDYYGQSSGDVNTANIDSTQSLSLMYDVNSSQMKVYGMTLNNVNSANIDSNQPLSLMYDVNSSQMEAVSSVSGMTIGNVNSASIDSSQPLSLMYDVNSSQMETVNTSYRMTIGNENVADIDSSQPLTLTYGVDSQMEPVTTDSGMPLGVEVGDGGVDNEMFDFFPNGEYYPF